MQATVKVPREGEWFEVNPSSINRELFFEERTDWQQEQARTLIVKAFAKWDKKRRPDRCFETLVPKMTWKNGKSVRENRRIARSLGDKMANWVEEALEWAQRITNGESWEKLCNESDTNSMYRLITWENGHSRIVGGSVEAKDPCSTTDVLDQNFKSDCQMGFTVPKVVKYEV